MNAYLAINYWFSITKTHIKLVYFAICVVVQSVWSAIFTGTKLVKVFGCIQLNHFVCKLDTVCKVTQYKTHNEMMIKWPKDRQIPLCASISWYRFTLFRDFVEFQAIWCPCITGLSCTSIEFLEVETGIKVIIRWYHKFRHLIFSISHLKKDFSLQF